jgi:phage terminase small subunit
MKTKPRVKAGTSKTAAQLRRAAFVEAYITNGGNATEAAISAGYSAKTAYSAGGRLLKDVDIAAAITARRGVLIEKFELTTERTLREIARLAYFDPRKMYNADGSLKAIHELDDDTAAGIAGIEVDEIKDGKVVIGVTRKFKQWDKNAALDKAMKHLGQYEQDNLQKGPFADMTPEALDKFIARKLLESGKTMH